MSCQKAVFFQKINQKQTIENLEKGFYYTGRISVSKIFTGIMFSLPPSLKKRFFLFFKRKMKIFQSIDSLIAKIEGALIVFILSSMILLSFSQVILRNFFEQGLPWADLLLRQLVLWVAFLGASLATRENRHLSIDFLKHFLPSHWNSHLLFIPLIFTSITSAYLTCFAWVFVSNEKESGTMLYGDIPLWIFQIILPFAFCLISIRFFGKALEVVTISFRSLTTNPGSQK